MHWFGNGVFIILSKAPKYNTAVYINILLTFKDFLNLVSHQRENKDEELMQYITLKSCCNVF